MNVTGLVVLCVAGTSLIVWGLRGKRVGTEPRCARCKYNLTGSITAELCPECGTSLASDGVVQGYWRPRRTMLLVGCLFLLVGVGLAVAVGYARLRGVPLCRYIPTVVLMRAAYMDRDNAGDELLRRVRAGVVSKSQYQALADVALDERSACGPYYAAWPQIADSLEALGAFTPNQRNRYFAEFVDVKLAVRERIQEGDPLVVAVNHSTRGSILGSYTVVVEQEAVYVDGVLVERNEESPRPVLASSECSGRCPQWSPSPIDGRWEPGIHIVDCRGSVHFVSFRGGSRQVVWSSEVHDEASFEVLDAA